MPQTTSNVQKQPTSPPPNYKVSIPQEQNPAAQAILGTALGNTHTITDQSITNSPSHKWLTNHYTFQQSELQYLSLQPIIELWSNATRLDTTTTPAFLRRHCMAITVGTYNQKKNTTRHTHYTATSTNNQCPIAALIQHIDKTNTATWT